MYADPSLENRAIEPAVRRLLIAGLPGQAQPKGKTGPQDNDSRGRSVYRYRLRSNRIGQIIKLLLKLAH